MTTDLVANLMAAFALVISAAALAHSVRQGRRQHGLTLRETEYVRLLLAKEHREAKLAETASLSARLYMSGKSDWRLKVFNRGPGMARNVRLAFDTENSLFSESWVEDKFPMEKMEAQQSVEILAFPHLQSRSKEDITLMWDDDSGSERSNIVTVTI